MSKPACIFHHPFPVQPEGTSGSRVRPYQMLKAFEALGYEVFTITGYALERKRQIRHLYSELAKGKHFQFAYSESHTLPAALTEPHHLPTHSRLDFSFFRRLNREQIPLGLFYRDVNWRFDQYKALFSAPKRHFATTFYRQEWNQYRRLVNHLFLPSGEMAGALPTPWPADQLSPLPPGINELVRTQRTGGAAKGSLHLLYVGGVTPPLYNLTPLFEAARACPQVQLTVCCRRQEWERNAGFYEVPETVEVVHASGEQLRPLYEQADAVAILRAPHPYLEFAMPVKVFEALAHGLPVLTSQGSETARFVEQEDVGWAVTSSEEVHRLVTSLLEHPAKLEAAYRRVANAQGRHTWKARAQHVVHTLTGPHS